VVEMMMGVEDVGEREPARRQRPFDRLRFRGIHHGAQAAGVVKQICVIVREAGDQLDIQRHGAPCEKSSDEGRIIEAAGREVYAEAMQFDSQGLTAFYDSPIGQVTRRLIQRRLKTAWPDVRGTRILGFGFPVPYLRTFALGAERAVAVLPEALGPLRWPGNRSVCALSEEDALPFPDSLFDRILLIHGLETAEATRPLMRQIWRVLAPEGRLLVVVPNRTSLWAQVDRSPFAHGRPFTRNQLDRLLRDTMFVPERWDTTLLLPPFKSRRLIRSGSAWERTGQILWPRLAGVHLAEASKSMYALAPVKKARRVLKPALTPARAA
jgi:SAM-dependent methyltransferase